MSWFPASRALLFRSVCENPPSKDKAASLRNIRDDLNSSIKRFQKRFTLTDISREIDNWYALDELTDNKDEATKLNEDGSASSKSKQTETSAPGGEDTPKGLTGRAARAHKRRRQVETAEDIDNESDSQKQAQTEDAEESQSGQAENLRSRRASRAARPSMTRSSLSPQRRARQPPRAKGDDETSSLKQKTKTTKSTAKRGKTARGSSESPQQEVSDSESESEPRRLRKSAKPKEETRGESARSSAKRVSRTRGEEKSQQPELPEDSSGQKKARGRRAQIGEQKKASTADSRTTTTRRSATKRQRS